MNANNRQIFLSKIHLVARRLIARRNARLASSGVPTTDSNLKKLSRNSEDLFNVDVANHGGSVGEPEPHEVAGIPLVANGIEHLVYDNPATQGKRDNARTPR